MCSLIQVLILQIRLRLLSKVSFTTKTQCSCLQYTYPAVVNPRRQGTDINNSNSGDASHSGNGTVGANRTYTLGVTIMTKGNTNPDDDSETQRSFYKYYS